MSKDSPAPSGGGRTSPEKPDHPGLAATGPKELRKELERLRAELEEERARGRADRRRLAAQARQLRAAAEREKRLEDRLRSVEEERLFLEQRQLHEAARWEQERRRLAGRLRTEQEGRLLWEQRRLRKEVQRAREAEIRQLPRWREAEPRQPQRVLSRELQRPLAPELLSRGHGARAGPLGVSAAPCRCRPREVLRQPRREADGEQAARIRRLQAELDVDRRLSLRYILEHFRWQPAPPAAPEPQDEHCSGEPLPHTLGCARQAPEPACRFGPTDGSGASTRARCRSLERMPGTRCGASDGQLLVRASSLDSWAMVRSFSLASTGSGPKASESEAQTPPQPPPSLSLQESPDVLVEPGSSSPGSAGVPASQPLDSRPQTNNTSSQSNSSTEAESMWVGGQNNPLLASIS